MSRSRYLVAPLNWGLGHATRCIPLINSFIKDGHEVIITANGRAEKLLRSEYPSLEFIASPEYNIIYSRTLPMWSMMLLQSPKILLNIYREHRWLSKIISEKKINKVISDNRYGLWTKKVECVFITHQVMIKCPDPIKFMEGILHYIVKSFMNKYTECWIPDIQGSGNLSGDLSHKYKIPANAKYIGWLSRFTQPDLNTEKKNYSEIANDNYSICIILSGPEPQRTVLENKILSMQSAFTKKTILVQGKTESDNEERLGENLRIVSHLSQSQLKKVISNSDLVVCRSGYSSIMDLKTLKKTVLLIPTPGQTEQEYLADYLSRHGEFIKMDQENFQPGFFNNKSSTLAKAQHQDINVYSE